MSNLSSALRLKTRIMASKPLWQRKCTLSRSLI
ncbi:Uncharacterised protein [Vibrio cholerae]|nr:Uncharacterised protein [Vibrio cholerae]